MYPKSQPRRTEPQASGASEFLRAAGACRRCRLSPQPLVMPEEEAVAQEDQEPEKVTG